jgi:hypothetical protein
VRSSDALLRQLGREAAKAEAEAKAKATEHAGHAEHADQQATPKRPSATTARAPQPSPPPPQPTGRLPWPTQAEIDAYVDRLIADPDAAVAAELWERYAAPRPSKTAQERAHGRAVALVADAWAERRLAR